MAGTILGYDHAERVLADYLSYVERMGPDPCRHREVLDTSAEAARSERDPDHDRATYVLWNLP